MRNSIGSFAALAFMTSVALASNNGNGNGNGNIGNFNGNGNGNGNGPFWGGGDDGDVGPSGDYPPSVNNSDVDRSTCSDQGSGNFNGNFNVGDGYGNGHGNGRGWFDSECEHEWPIKKTKRRP